jgi:predicted CopG family antitoxin
MKQTFKPIIVTDEVHYALMKRKIDMRKRSVSAVIYEMMEKEVQENGKTDGGVV